MTEVSDDGVLEVESTPAKRVGAAAALPPLIGAAFVLAAAATWSMSTNGTLVVGFSIALALLVWTIGLGLSPLALLLLRRREGGARGAFVDEERVLLGDSLRMRTEDVAVAWMPKPTKVEIVGRDGDEHVVTVGHQAAGERLLARIRSVAPRTRSYAVSLGTGEARVMRAAMAGWVLGASAMPLLFGPELVPAALLGAALAGFVGHGRGAIRFGADGVHLQGRFRSRYVSYRDVQRVHVGTADAATTSLAIQTPTERIWLGSFIPTRRARLLAALLEEGMAMVRSGAAAGAHVAELDPTEADPRAWTERLRHLTETQAYRAVAIDAQRLLSLLRNPAAEPRQRVAAALALRHTEGGLARIRVAADVSTDPDVQGALSALAEEHVEPAQVTHIVDRLARRSVVA